MGRIIATTLALTMLQGWDDIPDISPPSPPKPKRQTTERDLNGPNHRPHQGAREIARRLRRIQQGKVKL